MLECHSYVEDCLFLTVFEKSSTVETKYLSLFQDKDKAEKSKIGCITIASAIQ